ncbi:MAG: hypothetical protein QTN59_03200 [Candidatus Electrothrix communis]|nr:MAG: hypothetical protein QTN59_03200 [Candidatus Electrothrix communis]
MKSRKSIKALGCIFLIIFLFSNGYASQETNQDLFVELYKHVYLCPEEIPEDVTTIKESCTQRFDDVSLGYKKITITLQGNRPLVLKIGVTPFTDEDKYSYANTRVGNPLSVVRVDSKYLKFNDYSPVVVSSETVYNLGRFNTFFHNNTGKHIEKEYNLYLVIDKSDKDAIESSEKITGTYISDIEPDISDSPHEEGNITAYHNGHNLPVKIVDIVQGEIYKETGYRVDLKPASTEYEKYFDPNRKMSSLELEGGVLSIGAGCFDKTFGECLELATQQMAARCDKGKYSDDECYSGAKNIVVMLFAINRLASARKLPRKQRDKEINFGLFVATLSKYEQKSNKPYGVIYEKTVEILESFINSLSEDDTKLLNPTAEYVLSLSESEKAAYLFSTLALGATALIEYTKHLCRNVDCIDIANNDISREKKDTILKEKKEMDPSYYRKPKKKYSSDTDIFENDVVDIRRNGLHHKKWILYYVTCLNGYSENIYYNTQRRCWMKKSSMLCDYSSDVGALKRSAKTMCNLN